MDRETQTDKQTDTQTQTDRQTHWQRDRQTDTLANRQIGQIDRQTYMRLDCGRVLQDHLLPVLLVEHTALLVLHHLHVVVSQHALRASLTEKSNKTCQINTQQYMAKLQ